MELVREKEFVNQYHYDARNLEWEKENGTPKTNFEVTFQLVKKDTDNNQKIKNKFKTNQSWARCLWVRADTPATAACRLINPKILWENSN